MSAHYVLGRMWTILSKRHSLPLETLKNEWKTRRYISVSSEEEARPSHGGNETWCLARKPGRQMGRRKFRLARHMSQNEWWSWDCRLFYLASTLRVNGWERRSKQRSDHEQGDKLHHSSDDVCSACLGQCSALHTFIYSICICGMNQATSYYPADLSLDSGCKGRVYPAGKGQLFFSPQRLHFRWPYGHAKYAKDHYSLFKAGHCFTIVDTELPDVQQRGSCTLSPHLRNGPLFQLHFSTTSGMPQI